MTAQDIERAASAAYSAWTRLHANAPQWPDLPDHVQHKWRQVAGAALGAVERQPALTLRERLALKRLRESA